MCNYWLGVCVCGVVWVCVVCVCGLCLCVCMWCVCVCVYGVSVCVFGALVILPVPVFSLIMSGNFNINFR